MSGQTVKGSTASTTGTVFWDVAIVDVNVWLPGRQQHVAVQHPVDLLTTCCWLFIAVAALMDTERSSKRDSNANHDKAFKISV